MMNVDFNTMAFSFSTEKKMNLVLFLNLMLRMTILIKMLKTMLYTFQWKNQLQMQSQI